LGTDRVPRDLIPLSLDLPMVSLGGVSLDNEPTIFVDGSDAFEALLKAIGSAQQRVWLETFIFVADGVGKLILSALCAAAHRGVEVLVIIDALGSNTLGDDDLKELRAAGAQVKRYNPVPLTSYLSQRLRWFTRDHRKIWLVDDLGFTGGMNLADDYAGKRLGNNRFRDTQVLLQGTAVQELERLWLSTWKLVSAHKPLRVMVGAEPRDRGTWTQVLGGSRSTREQHIQRNLMHVLKKAKAKVWITTPYFMPPQSLLRTLGAAARRGCEVHILTAGKTDVPVARLAARYLYGRLLSAGVHISEYQAQTLHAKTLVVDGLWSSIGSFNLDRLSHQRNREVVATFVSSGIATAMEQQFSTDLLASTQVVRAQQDPWWMRVVGWLAYVVQGRLSR
jgi:cardiolipin synthase A/B